jgi:hypothetical protein
MIIIYLNNCNKTLTLLCNMSHKEVAIFTGGDSKYFAIMIVF